MATRSFFLRLPGDGETIRMGEEKITFKTDNEFGGGGFDYAIDDVPPDSGPPLHIHHRHDEAIHVVKGTFLMKVDGQQFTAEEDTFILIPKGIPHTFRNIGTETGRLIAMMTPGGTLPFYRELASMPFDADPSAVREIAARYDMELAGPPL